MACTTKYFYPVPLTTEDNETITAVFAMPKIVSCQTPENAVDDCAKLWNSAKCSANSPYFQLVPREEVFHIQFKFPDALNDWQGAGGQFGWRVNPSQTNWLIEMELLDGCCKALASPVEFTDFAPKFWVGADQDTGRWQTVAIDPSKIPSECFNFRVKVNVGGTVRTFYTEPYQKAIFCEKYVTIEGTHLPGKDCFGYYHGEPDFLLGGFFDYEDKIFSYGELERNKVSISKEEVNFTPVRTEVNNELALRLMPMPPYMIDRFANLFAAQFVNIDGRSFRFSGDISKNNDSNQMWLIDLVLSENVCVAELKCK